jgi:inosine-uridine nucleoside N-ribohydrolase
MSRSVFIVLLNLFFIITSAHPWKPAHYIIIDTDGGFDDMRAISMLLASPNVRVLAITSSNGVMDAKEAYLKLKSLLTDLHHEGLLIGMNNNKAAIAKNCQPAVDFKWGSEYEPGDSLPDAINTINYILTHTQEQISFVSLGSLITASDCSRQIPLFNKRIKEIIWTSDSSMNEDNFNYAISPESFEFITKETGIPLQRVYGSMGLPIYDADFTERIDDLANPYASKIISSLTSSRSLFSRNWFDEMAVIYLHYPFLFSSDTSEMIVNHQLQASCHIDSLEALTLNILDGKTVNQNQVLKTFPLDTSSYFPDVQRRMESTIKKFGRDEWTACVLGNELHRHLGVYAVIGVKMGIRAREYFGAGIDELQIRSFAGYSPPYSCMNDGLQVSTGGTLGHGLIRVAEDSLRLPKAEFMYLGQTISVMLKQEYRNKIEAEINELSGIYGLNSNIYWELIRIAALNYWANWDRNAIFEIQAE